MSWVHAVLRGLLLAGFVIKIKGKVKVTFRLIDYSNPSHNELDGGCCDLVLFSCGSACDNRFNLCFDEYGGNNNMAHCDYGNYVTKRLYENNDDFNFPSTLNDNLVNPIILTINQWSTGFRSKIEVWDYDQSNSDDKIDYYGYNYNYVPARTSALATEHIVTLNGAGTSLTRVGVKVYCDVHYYGTSSGCNTYCLARDNNQGHYDCNDITGARMCHAGWTGSYCQIEINECQSNPCESNAVCTDLLDDYSCNCPLGTEGKNCVDITECSSSPCEHGGTCLDRLNYYECQCTGEYSGANCELDIDFCQSNPCKNGGTCLGENDSGLLECACAAGYTGVFCAQDIDDCIGVDCLNNGTCHDGVDQFTCNCTDGYGGTFCQLDVRDECASDPCQNNASCVDKVGGYICVCQAGFQSDHCDEDINQCDPNPCSYGNCTDRVGRYTCECLPGYSGENCTINIDDCMGNMCDNNSTCQDHVNNYTCICMAGYTGVYCDAEIDECSSSPCQNNGICQDSVNSFTCQCASTGYQGQYCEIDIDECQDSSTCPSDTICDNVNGSYNCNAIPMEPTSIPGLCLTRLCYNDGICSLVNGSYQCVCSDDFTGEFCETPTELCAENTCNYGTCQVFTAGNGSVYYTCICQEGYSGTNCRNMEQPMITCPVIPILPTEEGESYATVSWEEPSISNGTITNNSGSVQLIFLGPGSNGGNFEIGAHVLTYLVIDEAGNSNNCSFFIDVIDPPICTSNHCLNGGTCNAFSGLFSCRCLDGFQGQTCQQAPVTCESGSNACNSTEECVNSVCRCRPNFIRINGVCIRNNRYRLTLTVISLLGESLEYMDSFSDPLSDEFESIADEFKVVVLSITSFINDITVVKLESGSVIFTFDSFVDVSVGESVVLSDFQEALGSSSTSDLIISPNTVPEISDFDECADATTNDCSLNANCRNTVGSYECTCYSNYNDESIGQSGSGRICVFHRGILIAMICVAVGFTLFIVCCGALCCRWSRYQQNISIFYDSQTPDDLYRPRRPHSKSGTRFIEHDLF